jgi:hypothetical protein
VNFNYILDKKLDLDEKNLTRVCPRLFFFKTLTFENLSENVGLESKKQCEVDKNPEKPYIFEKKFLAFMKKFDICPPGKIFFA